MKSTVFIFLVGGLMLLLVGCGGVIVSEPISNDTKLPEAPTGPNAPYPNEVTKVIPSNATDAEIREIDFEGDDVKEYLITYTSIDDISAIYADLPSRTNKHLIVMKKQNKWNIVKEDVAALDNVGVERDFVDISVIDFGNDGKQELFYSKSFGLRSREYKYTVFGLFEGKLQDAAIPKAYLNSGEYILPSEKHCRFQSLGATPSDQGIIEKYEIMCDGKNIPESDKLRIPFRTGSIFLMYVNGEFIPEKIAS